MVKVWFLRGSVLMRIKPQKNSYRSSSSKSELDCYLVIWQIYMEKPNVYTEHVHCRSSSFLLLDITDALLSWV